jgi:hypothetical protein
LAAPSVEGHIAVMAGQVPIFHAQHRSSGMQQRQCLISYTQVEAHADSLIAPLTLTALLSSDISSLQTLIARTSSPGSTHTPIFSIHHFTSHHLHLALVIAYYKLNLCHKPALTYIFFTSQ